ncbi:CcmD family protein [Chitinophagales bacterium]|nr:CcmD family protein [Chitinophagales bacterium]
MRLLVFILGLIVTASPLFAQGEPAVEMADALYASGKIYVVVAVLVLILLGLLGYLFMTDRKISKLEEEIEADRG